MQFCFKTHFYSTIQNLHVLTDGHTGCCSVTANGGTKETWEENKATMNFCIKQRKHI